MPMSVLFDIGRSWTSVLRAVSRTWRDAVVPEAGARGELTTAVARQGPDAYAAGGAIRTAGLALRTAFEGFATGTRPVYTTSLFTGVSTSATLSGLAARLDPLPSGPSMLRATVAVNTQTTTERSSSSPLGLDVATPEAPSTIQSTAEMNTAEGVDVDPAATFNGAPHTRPQFEGGATVAGGSFTVNGTEITVRTNDSINSVLATINGSAAGVTASLAGDRITLTTNASSEDEIVIANDTSGFVAATKLAGAVTDRGNIRDDEQVFAKAAQFAGVATGSFEINGVSIAVDANADSLQSVLSRINTAGAAVTAAYDEGADAVVITPDVAGATLTIGNDTSGFVGAIRMTTGAVGIAANPDGAFNDTGASGPLFDPGLAVGAGSFTVNGVTITVAADDTINTVLARITASEAGVTATYDEATGTVRLTSNESPDPIVVADDTSGFLAAVKLDGTAESITQPGTSAFETPFGEIAEYGSVVAGAITVNGQAIQIDPSTTTLDDVVSALNALPDMWAELDEATGAVTIRTLPGGSAEVTDTSGLLAALGISEGTYAGTVGETTALRTQAGTVPSNTPEVVDRIASAVAEVNTALSEMAGQAGNGGIGGERSAALHELVDTLRSLGVDGVSVTAGDSGAELAVDRDTLRAALDGMSNPAAARAAIVAAVDVFTGAAARIAGTAAEAAAAAAAREPVTIQLPPLPLLDPAAAAARRASARAPARASAYTQNAEPLPGRADVFRSAGSPSAVPVAATSAVPRQPGLFEGLLEEWLKVG